MKTMMLLASLLVVGCGPQGDPMPLQGQADAIRIAWNQIFGETRQPPPIYWRWDRCDEPNGIYPPLPWCTFTADGEKMAGLQSDDGWIELGGPWATGKMSDTSLAHELLHASIGDAEHKTAAWETILPKAEKAISEAGL